MRHPFPPPHAVTELNALEHLLEQGRGLLRADCPLHIPLNGHSLPVWCIELGSTAPDAPVAGFFGGIHGMERIGSQILLAWLESLVARASWDVSLQDLLQKVRIVCLPMVNIGGLMLNTRANPNGVDLMRNAPVDAHGFTAWPLGGQRLSPRLPWYRGHTETLEPESALLVDIVRRRLLNQPFSLAMDCHSGFGLRDRIWFPWACSREAPPHLAEAVALREIFNNTYPNHDFYLMEPQSLNYTTHGDLWDYLYLEHLQQSQGRYFLPFTLEMGSWLWVKKNPRQLFDWFGHFNPILPHRLKRVLRRHLTLFDFMLRAAASWEQWLPRQEEVRRVYRQAGMERWFAGKA
ncbi:MAG: M14 family zinc carboxypeptidase [Fluviicoccus sp.]|uniref:M14 family zinc carboxypeptidase n=1 Tax=Fluviicoccus sp. TaxID=2003552 RepID=UPI00271E7389|nr:M14 family zinc carboxypeptidase [Fluviicoccus sp.]MDO8331175.1 M14 family zinc carboxypeptidase [Fluviicoccus sp.]